MMNPIVLSVWLKTQKRLTSYVYSKVRDKSLTEDIIQDVFIKVHSHAEALREKEKITAWMYQITHNVVMDYFRTQSKPVLKIDLTAENGRPNFNECVSDCLQEMLQEMPEKYRQAIELTAFENLSQLELAKQLQITYSGAKSRVQRARQMLREKMGKTYRIQPDAYGNAISCKSQLPCGCE